MTQFASPVLHTLLDTDAYKLHMQQAVFHHYYDVHVAAEFRCRGDDLLGIYADSIREQVDAMQHLALRDDEYQWLAGLPFFKADYLNWLRDFRYNPAQVTVTNDNGKLNIRLEGRGASDYVGSAAAGSDQRACTPLSLARNRR